MLDLLRNTVDEALEDGYEGLWTSGDMTWEFGSERNFAKLQEYERGLEELFRRTPHSMASAEVQAVLMVPAAAER